MEPLYYETHKIIIEVQQLFQKFEKLDADPNIENEILARIDQVSKNCEKLDAYVFKTPAEQRARAKMRVDQLKYDIRHLKAAFQSLERKKQRQIMEMNEREQLLNRKFDANADTTINIDYSLQHNTSLQNANRGVDEMLYTGSSILESLRSQRGTLKGAHRRLIDMANTLGLSNHTMRLIERRVSEDKYLLFGGMFFTCVVIVLVIVYIA